MDRYLLTGAFSLLTFLILVLLGDLGILPFHWSILGDGSLRSQTSIGFVEYTKQNVRKRSLDSIVWEDSSTRDPLYSYDSVLTLSKSSAQLQLNDGSKVSLHENTLVVLEPKTQDENPQLRLRFSMGNIRGKFTKQQEVTSKEWIIETKDNSDIHLRSVGEDEIRMEVLQGEVRVKKEGEVEKRVKSGEQITIEENQLSSVTSLTKEVTWKFSRDQRVYTHKDMAPFTLQWEGQPSSVIVQWPDGTSERLSITSSSLTLQIPLGTSYFNLEKDGLSSPTLAVHIWPAPALTYFSPLPRDRVKTGENIQFSWSPLKIAQSYKVQIHNLETNKNGIVKSTAHSLHQLSLPAEGTYNWSVIGVDEEGFEIPPLYPYEIHSIDNPLSPPTLRPLQPRQPANKGDGAWLEKLWHWIFPSAAAETKKDFRKRVIAFTWFPVADADHYIIEISEDPSFRRPIVMERVTEERYEWTEFDKKTYYWRVAAGQGARKGLFSDAAQADLSNLSDLKIGELYPGVEYQVAKVKSQPKPTPVAQPGPPTPPKSLEPPKPLKLNEAQKNFKGHAWLSGAQHNRAFDNGEDFTSTLSGFSQIHFATSLNFPLGKVGSFLLNLRYLFFEWEPKYAETLPLQKPLENEEVKLLVLYKPPRGQFSYGIASDTLSAMEKDGFEEVKITPVHSVGLALLYLGEFWNNWQHEHELIVARGDELLGTSLSNHLRYHISTGEPVDFFVGGLLDYKRYSDEEIKLTDMAWGLTLGIDW